MKSRKNFFMAAGLGLVLAGVGGNVFGDEGEGGFLARWFNGKDSGVAPVDNPLYLEECGGCHFAYQPALLPARSWQKVMSQLDDHFGENAELPEDERKEIDRYLKDNAAEHSDSKISRKFLRSLGRGQTPLRISRIPYFVKEHDELPRRMVQGNQEVGSFSRCDACHVDAASGRFDEHEVRIPGFGRWEDD